MSFNKVNASSREEIVQTIVNFAVDHSGFTDQGPITINNAKMQRLSKNGFFWYLYAEPTSNNIRLRMGYQLLTTWPTSATSQENDCYMSLWGFPGPYSNLYLYADGVSLFAIVEATNGIFNHIAFGNITKTETFTGGEFVSAGYYYNGYTDSANVFHYYDPWDANNGLYMTGSQNSNSQNVAGGYVRSVPLSGALNDYRDFARMGAIRNNQGAQAEMGPYSRVAALMRDAPNVATLRTPMYPMYISLRDPTSGLYRGSGYIENIRVVPMKYLDPSEIIYTDWQAFPLTQKDGPGLVCPNSGNWGLAYRRIP